MRVCEMASGGGGSRPPVVDTEVKGIVPKPIIVDSVQDDGMIANDSGNQPEGPPDDVVESAPSAPRYVLSPLFLHF